MKGRMCFLKEKIARKSWAIIIIKYTLHRLHLMNICSWIATLCISWMRRAALFKVNTFPNSHFIWNLSKGRKRVQSWMFRTGSQYCNYFWNCSDTWSCVFYCRGYNHLTLIFSWRINCLTIFWSMLNNIRITLSLSLSLSLSYYNS